MAPGAPPQWRSAGPIGAVSDGVPVGAHTWASMTGAAAAACDGTGLTLGTGPGPGAALYQRGTPATAVHYDWTRPAPSARPGRGV